MSALAGPFFAAALLLAVAGGLKVARPRSAALAMRSAGLPGSVLIGRLLGVVEIGIAVAALVVGGPVTAALVAACYLGFAGFVVRLRRRAGAQADCGCFGAETSPASPVHVVLNLVLAAVSLAAVAWPTDGIVDVLADSPAAGIPFLGFTLLLTWLLLVAFTVVPDLLDAQRDVDAAGRGVS
jgi:Methylamine utilisation protein MauE